MCKCQYKQETCAFRSVGQMITAQSRDIATKSEMLDSIEDLELGVSAQQPFMNDHISSDRYSHSVRLGRAVFL